MISAEKRKRVSVDDDRPNKRLQPVITTSNIRTPDISFDAYKSETTILLQSSAHPRLDYTAEPIEDSLVHYIAIQDGENVSFYPAQYSKLQCIPRTSVQEKPRLAISAQRIALGQEFGTKKAKKAIASKTVNAISSVKDDTQDAILEEVAETTGKEEMVNLASTLSSKPIPQPNLEATVVEEVYPLNTLMPFADQRLLDVSDWLEKTNADENIELHHRFIAYRVGGIGKANDVPRLKALLYISLLLRFNDVLKPAGRNGHKVPAKEVLVSKLATSDALVNSIRKRFSDEKNELGKWHREKLHTHICALALYIDQYDTNTSHLRDDLKIDNKAISQYYSELGAKITAMTEKERAAAKIAKAQAGGVRMARLKLPLEFPKAKRR